MITQGNLLERLVERVGGGRVRAAFFSTYTFGPGYFADGPLAAFTREGADRGVIPITVVVDSRRFRGAVRGYEVVRAPFNLWHAKIVLLMVAEPGGTGRWTVMAVGSGNLTRSGWEHNLEFFAVDSWAGWSIPKALGQWFAEPWLAGSAFASWCKRHGLGRKNGDRSSVLLSSIHQPLWPRIALEANDATWTDARVLAPFSDQSADDDAEPGGSGGGFLKALVQRAAPGATLHVYLRGLDPNRDEAVGVQTVFEDLQKCLGRTGLKLHVVRPVGGRLLHAKLVAWRSSGLWSVVLGSPNATRAAMLDPPGKTGNVELGWQFERIGRTLPADLFPRIPALSVEDITFRAPAFDNRPPWDAVEEARYDAALDRVRITWRAGWSVKDTELRLGANPVHAARITLARTEHRALEVRPRKATDRKTHRAVWVPIEIPADVFDPDGAFDGHLEPEEWLQQLGDPYASSTREGSASAGGRRTKGRRSAARGPSAWDWNTRVRTFEGQVGALAAAVRDAETEAAIARLVRVVKGAWAAHDPASAARGAKRAWCKWVRAGIVEALQVADRRVALHRPLCALLAAWEAAVDPRLLGGRDV